MIKSLVSWIFCSVLLASAMEARALVYLDYKEVAMFGASVNAQLFNDGGLTPAITDFSSYLPPTDPKKPDILFGNMPSDHNIVFKPNTGTDSTSLNMRRRYDEADLHAPIVNPDSFFGVKTGTIMIGLVGEICSDGDVVNLDAIKYNINYMMSDFQTRYQKVVLMAYPTNFKKGAQQVSCPNGNNYMELACAYNEWAQTVADNHSKTELIDPWQDYSAIDNFHASRNSLIIASDNVKACFEGGFGVSCVRYDPSNCIGM
jgi:hypothetical protein